MEGRRLAVVLIVTSCLPALTVGESEPTPDVCLQPKVVGPCKAKFRSYYYDSDLDTCQMFIYGGCGGNGNRFLTKDACLNTCIYPLTGNQGY
uniref:Conotoxin superfamily conkunitzin 3 n=1 Tax=Conus magus TaxID=6492 RepID=A0A679PIH9_CONMA|nr:TPA_inf: conotoxin superfamily conkunitzin 3 [Conus magus]